MSPYKSSDSERPLHHSSTPIPDLTDRISRPDDQYCEAGGFGDVFRCRYTSDNGVKEVAVKSFRFNFTVEDSEHKRDGGKGARMIRRELGIWSRLHHPNIVPFLGITYGFGKQGSASLVSMWMPHGTLHSFLEAYGDQLAIAHRLQLLLDIANGLHYLHSFPLIHGDLSSSNVLLDHNLNACLTDFGCASLVGELPEGFAYLKMSTVRPGTLRWAAPEHFSFDDEETKHTTKSDIYSFGNMALLVLSGKYPWSEVRADTAVVLRLSQGLKPGRPLVPSIDDQHWALIERCWSSVPERPLAEDVASSLQQFLDVFTLPPLREFLGAVIPLPNAEDHLGDFHSTTALKRKAATAKRVIHARPDSPQVISKWIRGNLVGKGTYGSVYLAVDTSTGEMFAVKQVDKRNHLNFLSELKMEREILGGLDHPHIVAYLGTEETVTSLSIFLEYIAGGTISTCLKEHGRFDEEVIKSFTFQILDGLVYLHANHIIHRNIEAGNVLVDLSGICKLSGFGNAQRTNDDRASWTPMRGIVFWTAPEMTAGRRQGGKWYGPKVDVWSTGCVLLKMWAGGRAWQDGNVFALMVKATSRGTSLPLPSDVILSDLAVDFSKRCFVTDPDARATATELLQHPYLTLDPDWVFSGFK